MGGAASLLRLMNEGAVEMRKKPEFTWDTMKRMKDMTWFTHAKIFDDLLIVAQRETACYVLKTEEGLTVIDGIWPDRRAYDEILLAIEDAGWGNEKITKFMITHGHKDHVGCGKHIADSHDVKTYLSAADDALRLDTPHNDDFDDSFRDFDIDCHISDGDMIDGIKVIGTPGHTKGCMSFIFPVHDDGEEHMACLFGGATPPWDDEEGKKKQRESVSRFKEKAKEYHCDVALANHTFVDNGQERIAYSRERMEHMPNIYVFGEDGVQRFLDVFLEIAR